MNPKDRIGSKKVSTFVVPATALYHMALALMDGARKYGAYNWRDEAIQASIYLDAIQRHKDLYASGEDVASDSKVKHLAHIMGCCAILIDAELHGKLIDDRRKSPEFVKMLARLNDFTKHNHADPVTDGAISLQQIAPVSLQELQAAAQRLPLPKVDKRYAYTPTPPKEIDDGRC